MAQIVVPQGLAPKGFQQITNVSAAVGLTVPAGARVAVVQTTGQSVTWRDDGTAPTASIGSLVNAGDTLIYGGTLAAIKFIQTAASATLNVAFYG